MPVWWKWKLGGIDLIDNTALETIFTTATDLNVVCEIYASDAVPAADGFDPNDAIGCFAAVDGISFMGVDYVRLVSKFGSINKSIGGEVNTASVTFSNVSREIADFEFTNGFEGLILVIRTLSRSLSVALTDTKIEFAGRCDKPDGGDKQSLTVTAKFILGSLDVSIPRRKFVPEDPEGRVSTDPEFEGFIFMPQYGSVTFTRRERRGFLIFHWHHTVQETLQYSSYSNIDTNKSLPEVFGRAQIEGTLIGGVDLGPYLQTRTAFCEGEILDMQNIRILDSQLADVAHTIHYGKVGALNGDDPTYVAPGYYSRTAEYRANLDNSAIDVTDAVPGIAALIYGRLIPIPTAGVWGGSEWSDNAAAHTRFVLTDAAYYKLNTAWLEDSYFTESYDFNNEYIFNTELADFTFVEEG